jgi:hypothetical protein
MKEYGICYTIGTASFSVKVVTCCYNQYRISPDLNR